MKHDYTAAASELQLGANPALFIQNSSASILRSFGQSNGNSGFEQTVANGEINLFQSSWDISLASDEVTQTKNGSNAGNIIANDNTTNSFVNSVLSVFGLHSDTNPSNNVIPLVLIYPSIPNVPTSNEIQKYLTRKYIRDTYSITTVEGSDQRLTLSKTTTANAPFEITFIFKPSSGAVNNHLFTNTAFTQRLLVVFSTGVIVTTGVGGLALFIDGMSVPTNTDLRNHIGKTITATGLLTGGLDIDYIISAPSQSSNMTLINAKFDTEAFNLPEGTGTTTTGTGGTVATLVNGATWDNYTD